jgi:WD40 repeat protein
LTTNHEAIVIADAHPRRNSGHAYHERVVTIMQTDRSAQPITAPKLVRRAAFSSDATRLALACAGRIALVTDLAGREQLRIRHGWFPKVDVLDVAFDSAGGRIVTAGTDGTARIWDATTGDELLRMTHPGSMNAAAFSADGGLVATASDREVVLWAVVDR